MGPWALVWFFIETSVEFISIFVGSFRFVQCFDKVISFFSIIVEISIKLFSLYFKLIKLTRRKRSAIHYLHTLHRLTMFFVNHLQFCITFLLILLHLLVGCWYAAYCDSCFLASQSFTMLFHQFIEFSQVQLSTLLRLDWFLYFFFLYCFLFLELLYCHLVWVGHPWAYLVVELRR